jgi:hypothetical protein
MTRAEKCRATWAKKIAAGYVSPTIGRKHTPEARDKIATSRRGKKHTAESRAKMGAGAAAYQARVREALAALNQGEQK